jgi:hypothetical protein
VQGRDLRTAGKRRLEGSGSGVEEPRRAETRPLPGYEVGFPPAVGLGTGVGAGVSGDLDSVLRPRNGCRPNSASFSARRP